MSACLAERVGDGGVEGQGWVVLGELPEPELGHPRGDQVALHPPGTRHKPRTRPSAHWHPLRDTISPPLPILASLRSRKGPLGAVSKPAATAAVLKAPETSGSQHTETAWLPQSVHCGVCCCPLLPRRVGCPYLVEEQQHVLVRALLFEVSLQVPAPSALWIPGIEHLPRQTCHISSMHPFPPPGQTSPHQSQA